MTFDLSTEHGRAQAYASGAEGARLVLALELSALERATYHNQDMAAALEGLLATTELNMDDLEPDTRYQIQNALAVLKAHQA